MCGSESRCSKFYRTIPLTLAAKELRLSVNLQCSGRHYSYSGFKLPVVLLVLLVIGLGRVAMSESVTRALAEPEPEWQFKLLLVK